VYKWKTFVTIVHFESRGATTHEPRLSHVSRGIVLGGLGSCKHMRTRAHLRGTRVLYCVAWKRP